MKYLKKFSKHSDYLNSPPDTLKPTVSICKLEGDIHYDRNYYSKLYFTSEILDSGTFTLTIGGKVTTEDLTNISYSLDNGETWVTTNNIDNTLVSITTPTLNAGDKVLWKGRGKRVCAGTGYTSTGYACRFNSTSSYNVSGNITSLFLEDDFRTKENLNKKVPAACFTLFFGTDNARNRPARINSAKFLYLPPKVDSWGYRNMFWNCELLEEPPRVIISEVGERGCDSMFYNAKNIEKIEVVLNATSLSDYCYEYMFYGCRNLTLTTVSELPATTLADYCYQCMFYNCVNLTKAPELPATTLESNCYNSMFYGCTSLTVAPELPATTLAERCYSLMFYNCTALTTTPALPAITLVNNCYTNMFYNCTALTTTPALPATTLADNCYFGMFNGTNVLPDCTNIDFTLQSVVASGGLKGLFYGTKVTDNDLANILPINNSKYCLPVTTLTDLCYLSMFKFCTNLTTAPELPATTLITKCYNEMFYGCTSLVTAPTLPAITLADYCYEGMFEGCTSLITVPELPATTLATCCYRSMFYGCTSLTTAPELPATTLTQYCYRNMFNGCTSLTTAPSLPATTLANYCYDSMFSGCTSLTTAPLILPATTLASYCYSSMFYNCNNLITAPKLPATTLVSNCYSSMFYNCNKLSYLVCLAENITDITNTNFIPKGSAYLSKALIVSPNIITDWNNKSTGWEIYAYANENEEYSMTAVFNITSIEDATSLINSNSLRFIKKLEIDLTELSIVSSYKFDTLGEHTIKYNFNITSIPKHAFSTCDKMISFTMTNITSISEYAFHGTNITNIVIPNSVTSVEEYAFYRYLNGPTSLYVGSGVTSLNVSCINKKYLLSIIVDSNNITYDSRNNCNAVVKKSNNGLVLGCLNTVLPSNVTRIEVCAFENVYFESFTISATITYIGDSAINNCSRYIFSSVLHLWDLCSGKSLVGLNEEGESSLISEIYIGSTKLTNLVIPSNVTSINEHSLDFLYNIEGVTSITFSDNIVSLPYNIYYFYTGSVSTINFGNGITQIPDYFINYNSRITTIVLGNNVTSIGEETFYGCSNLTTINIPDSVVYIGNSAFYGCNLLPQATKDKILSINSNAFDKHEHEEEEW